MKRPRRSGSRSRLPPSRQPAAGDAGGAARIPPDGSSRGPLIVVAVLVCFAVVQVSLELGSYTRTSATWDEPGHLAAGYAAIAQGDYRLDIEHPPLLRMWAALPLLWTPGVSLDTQAIDKAPTEAIAFQGPFQIGHGFLYGGHDADRMLYRSRSMIVLLSVALGVLVFSWTAEWIGLRAAIVALALYTLEPNLSAHGALATTDLGVACFMFGTIYFLWRTSRRMSAGNLAAMTACFVLAVLSKFSAIILFPVVGVLMAMAALRRRTFTPATAAAILLLLAVATWAGAWAAYGFRFAPSRSDTWLFTLQDHAAVRQAVPRWASLVGWVDAHHLLPNAFTQGFLHGQGLVQGRPAFLAGDYSTSGWWYYFPLAFLWKTPLALQMLFCGGLFVCVRRRRLLSLDGEAFVVLPAVMFLAIAMSSALNIGVRHILPIYPFVVVMAAIGANALLRTAASRGSIVLGAAMAVAVLEFGAVYPHTLAFFNILAGGSHNGFRYLADSNVDWGQDLKPLKAWMDWRGVTHINLAYFGTADPAYYQMDCTYIWGTTIPGITAAMMGPPRLPGYVAVSVTLLDGVPFGERERGFYQPLRDREPAADIGGSIRVYWVEQPWW